MRGSDGAIATSARPHGGGGSPLTAAQVLPPSALRNRPLPLWASGPSPPERNVQPLRRKSHSPAKSTSGWRGSSATDAQPVDRFGPLRTRLQLLPPSTVL